MKEKFGLTEIQPDRWVRTPIFDKEGRPVRYLQTTPRGDVPNGLPRTALRDSLIEAIRDAGLHRPVQSKRRRIEWAIQILYAVWHS